MKKSKFLTPLILLLTLLIIFFISFIEHGGKDRGLIPFIREDILNIEPPVPCHTNPADIKNYIPDYYEPDYMRKPC